MRQVSINNHNHFYDSTAKDYFSMLEGSFVMSQMKVHYTYIEKLLHEARIKKLNCQYMNGVDTFERHDEGWRDKVG